MSSEIEQLANNLRALASHAGGTGREVGQAAQASGELAENAHAQGRSGLAVGSLVGQLQAAAKRAGAAAAAIEQVAANGDSFADHLAASRSSHAVGGIRAGILTAALGVFVSSPVVNPADLPSTDIPSDVGTHHLQQSASSIDRAAGDADRAEGASQLNKRTSSDITQEQGKK